MRVAVEGGDGLLRLSSASPSPERLEEPAHEVLEPALVVPLHVVGDEGVDASRVLPRGQLRKRFPETQEARAE